MLPGPRRPPILQSLEWQFADPLRLFDRYAASYGDMFQVRLLGPREGWDRGGAPFVPRDVVVVSSPAQLRQVFAHSHHALRTGQAHGFLAWYFGDDSLLTLDGEPHVRERRFLHSVLAPEILPGFANLVRETARRTLATWPVPGRVSLRAKLEELGLDAILGMVFGRLTDGQIHSLRRLTRAGAIASYVPYLLLVHPRMRRDHGRLTAGGRLRRVRAAFRAFVADRIDRRLANGTPAGDGDLLGQLTLGHSDLRDDAERTRLVHRLEMLLGAMANVSPALAWCCFHLGRNPLVLEQARAAARNGEDGIAFVDAVCRESLRLNPPFVGSMRRVAEPVEVGGVSLRPGTYVLPCQYLTHRRPEVYPEPLRFLPERFQVRGYAAHEYAPFGGGVRRCVGEAIALTMMRLLLTEMLTTVDFEPAPHWSGRGYRRNTLTFPRDPLFATLRRRMPGAPTG
jgi:cytochrome P450